MKRQIAALGLWFVALALIFVALLHILLSAMAETSPQGALVLGLLAAGSVLLIVGARFWKRSQ